MFDSMENFTELPPGTVTLRFPLLGIDRMTVTPLDAAPLDAATFESPAGWDADAEPVAGSMHAANMPSVRAVRASDFIFNSGFEWTAALTGEERRADAHALTRQLIV